MNRFLPSRDVLTLQRHSLWRLLQVAAATVIGSVLVGRLLTFSIFAQANEDPFDETVEVLQAIPGLTTFSETATDLGKLNLNYLMLAGIAAVAVFVKRDRALPWVVVALGSALLLRPFQSVISRLVDGSSPTGSLVQGTSGPYFSGGVFRVVVVAGLLAALFITQRRNVYLIAIAMGVLEGVTRLTLGRHWVLDTVASIPIGLAVLWCLLQVIEILEPDGAGCPAGGASAGDRHRPVA